MILLVGSVQQDSFMYHLHTSSVCFKLGCSAVSCSCLTPKWGKLSRLGRFGVGSPQKDCRRQPFPESMIGRWKPLKFLSSHIWVGWLGRGPHVMWKGCFVTWPKCHKFFLNPKQPWRSCKWIFGAVFVDQLEVISYPRPCFPNTSNYLKWAPYQFQMDSQPL